MKPTWLRYYDTKYLNSRRKKYPKLKLKKSVNETPLRIIWLYHVKNNIIGLKNDEARWMKEGQRWFDYIYSLGCGLLKERKISYEDDWIPNITELMKQARHYTQRHTKPQEKPTCKPLEIYEKDGRKYLKYIVLHNYLWKIARERFEDNGEYIINAVYMIDEINMKYKETSDLIKRLQTYAKYGLINNVDAEEDD